MLPPFSMGVGGVAEHIVSPLSVRTSVPFVRPSTPSVRKNGFRSISFEKIGVLNSYFIHRYIIIKCRYKPIEGKIQQ